MLSRPLITIMIFLCAWYLQTELLLHWDVSWLTLAAGRWLAGGNYIDSFFETTPPLIIYLSTPPWLLIKFFNLDYIVSIRLYIMGLILVSFLLSVYLSKFIFSEQHRWSSSKIRTVFLASLLCALLFFPISEFGQREHLLIVLTMPYFLLTSARVEGWRPPKWISFSVGLLAGLGFNIKPYFFLSFILVEIYYALASKKISSIVRTETISIACLSIVYLASIFIFHPSYVYLILPYIIRLYYFSVAFSLFFIVQQPLFLYSVFILLFFAVSYTYNRTSLTLILFFACYGFCGSYLAQRTTMYYHLYPAFVSAFLLGILQYCQIVTAQKQKILLNIALLVAALSLLGFNEVQYLWTIIVLRPTVFYIFFSLVFLFSFYLCNKQEISWNAFFIKLCTLLASTLFFSYLVLGTNFYTHRFMLTVLFISITSIYLLPQKKLSHIFFYVLALLLFFLPAWNLAKIYQFKILQKTAVAPLSDFFKNYPHRSIYCLNSSTQAQEGLIDPNKLIYVSRFPFFWMLTGINKEPKVLREKDLHDLLQKILADFKRKQPDFVIVDISQKKDNFRNLPFNYLTFIASSPELMHIWQDYHLIKTFEVNYYVMSKKVYAVYAHNSAQETAKRI